MSMGKRKCDRQPAMWVTATNLPTAASHPFYRRLNQLLREHGFDAFVEAQCAGFYAATMGRPGLLPRIYFRLLLTHPRDPDAKITKMKDGRTHLAYKAEHAIDLETEAIVAAQVTHADRGDAQTGRETILAAQVHLVQSGSEAEIKEVVQDKGYHDNTLLAWCAAWDLRTYIPERKQKSRTWTNKPEEYEAAFRANRRRVGGERGRQLNRWRSERCERSFAHVCETGGGRRMWLRGVVNASKSHLMRCCAYNLGLLMRKCFGLAKPRSGGAAAALFFVIGAVFTAIMTTSALSTLSLSVGCVALIVIALSSLTALALYPTQASLRENHCS